MRQNTRDLKPVLLLLGCLFIAMIGFGVTLPVLPFFTERMAAAEGATRERIALHVGALTAVYAFMQLLLASAWGIVSDRRGRKWPLVLGIAGAGIGQMLFATATSLSSLYAARIFSGAMAAAALPIASASVADLTEKRKRGQGMAWLGTTASLGVMAGLVLGGLSAREDFHLRLSFGHLLVDGFSVPFVLSGGLMLLAAGAALRWMPESRGAAERGLFEPSRRSFRELARSLRWLLGLAFVAQFGLALFEGTFALYAQEKLSAGPSEVALAFLVCGAVMAGFQPITIRFLSPWFGPATQIAIGFALVGAGVALVVLADSLASSVGFIALLALGMAMVYPNLSALVSLHGEAQHGTALGMQNAANSFGQTAGPLIGTSLFAWKAALPYLATGIFMLSMAALIGCWRKRPELAAPPSPDGTSHVVSSQ